MVERYPDKIEVEGSIPSTPTNLVQQGSKELGPVVQLVERLICNEEISGSNPLRSIKYRLELHFNFGKRKFFNHKFMNEFTLFAQPWWVNLLRVIPVGAY